MNGFRGFSDSWASFCPPAENKSPTEPAYFLALSIAPHKLEQLDL